MISSIKRLFVAFTLFGGPLLPANSLLTGTFIDINDGTYANNPNDIVRAVRAYRAMGLDTLIIASTAIKPNAQGCGSLDANGNPQPLDPFVPAGGNEEGMYSRVKAFLDEAKASPALPALKVVIGLSFSMVACPAFHSSANNLKQTLRKDTALVREFERRFAHYGSVFDGYYVPNETGATDPATIAATKADVDAIRAQIPKGRARKIYNSPYLGNASSYHWTPDLVAQAARNFLNGTGVDVLLYQDSVGASATNMGAVAGEYRLEEYFQKIVDYVGADRIYSDVELFNDGNVGSAGFMRVNQQLWQSRMTGGRIAYIAQGQMYPINVFNAHPGAPRLFAEYQAEFRQVGRRYGNFTYRFIGSQPVDNSDNGIKLKDTLVGNPRSPLGYEWVRLPGDAMMEIDLKTNGPVPVDYVAIHVLASRANSIGFPTGIRFSFSAKGNDWTDWTPEVLAEDTKGLDGEYVMANSVAFGKSARFIRLYLRSTHPRTYLSEITVTSAR